MAIKLLSAVEVQERSVKDLGLDAAAIDLSSCEAIAGLLRRSAQLLCPCPHRSLVDAVIMNLRGLISTENLRELVEDSLTALVSCGDLLELEEVGEGMAGARKLLYAAPPAFVARQSGAIQLVGIFDGITSILSDGEGAIECVGHVRRAIVGTKAAVVRERLLAKGFIELNARTWLSSPPRESAQAYLARLGTLLERAAAANHIAGLTVINPTTSNRYYRGRWAGPDGLSGRFVGRRPQAFGADLWCYVELAAGIVQRFVDLPIDKGSRGCDDAWRVQMAVDSGRGAPQLFRSRKGSAGVHVLDFFGPLPAWAQRRLDVIANPSPSGKGLFSYVIRDAELKEEVRFLETDLWLVSEGNGNV